MDHIYGVSIQKLIKTNYVLHIIIFTAEYWRRDSASTMFVCNGIDTFDVPLRKAVHSFKRRLQQSSNTIVSCLNNNDWIVNNCMHTGMVSYIHFLIIFKPLNLVM